MKKENEIVFYDFNNLFYSSFYILGLMQNAKRFGYKFSISKNAPSILIDEPITPECRSLLFSVCLFEVRMAGEKFFCCIDTRDSSELSPEKGNGYLLPLLEKTKHYFKVNYRRESIENDPALSCFRDRIVPVMPFIPVQCHEPLALLPRLTPCPETGWTKADVIKRLKALWRLPSLEYMRHLRSLAKDKDIFFVLRFYHEKEHLAENEFRLRIMQEIRRLRPGSSLTGFASNRPLPEKFADFQVKEYVLKEYLRQAASARVAIYVRGMFNCISFKLGQVLSMGLPVIGQPVLNNRDFLMNNPGFEDQFAFENPEEIAGKAVELLASPDRLKSLGASNAKIFDEKFTPEAAVAGMLGIIKFH